MAAVITPLAAPGAPTVVTIERTVHANNPRNLAEDPYVTNNGSASLSRALVGSLYIKINIPTYSRRSRWLPRTTGMVCGRVLGASSWVLLFLVLGSWVCMVLGCA